MNTYFEEIITVVQSEQFANEFKSTIKFILRLVNLLFLVIAGLFILVKVFVCRQLGCKEELSLKEETLLPVFNCKMKLPIYDCKEEQETNLEFTNEDINEGSNVEFTNQGSNDEVINEASNVETDNVEVETDNTNSILENQTEEISTEEVINEEVITENNVDLTVGGKSSSSYLQGSINNQLENDKSDNDKSDNNESIRQKELNQMKAAQLRKLCTDYSLNYQNKQQAVTVILDFEFPGVVIPF